jgi:hypothetical protein
MAMRFVFALLILAGCRTAAPTTPIPTAPDQTAPPQGRPPETKAYNWRNDGNLRQEQGDEYCRADQPLCRKPRAIYVPGPNSCRGRGTACLETKSREDGHWACLCDECTRTSECKSTQYCGTGGPQCSDQPMEMRCIDGPEPPAVDCQPFQNAPAKPQ